MSLALASLLKARNVRPPRCCSFSSESNPLIPVVDISSLYEDSNLRDARQRCGAELIEAAARVGLFYVVGHGIDQRLLDQARCYSASFFAQPSYCKEEISIRQSPSRRGYQRLGDNVTQGARDQHEAIDFYRDMGLTQMGIQDDAVLASSLGPTNVGTNQWPREDDVQSLGGFRSFFEEEYVPSMLHLGALLMRGLASGLGVSSNTFDNHFDKSFWVLRLIRYPAILSKPLPNALYGCGQHTDYGCLTIVNQDPNPSHSHCLEALIRTEDGVDEWTNVPSVPGALAVNIGDMLEHWTRDRKIKQANGGGYHQGLRATPHRIRPPSKKCNNNGRISVPFFFEPNYDAVIRPLPTMTNKAVGSKATESIIYGSYLLQKVSNNFPGVNGSIVE